MHRRQKSLKKRGKIIKKWRKKLAPQAKILKFGGIWHWKFSRNLKNKSKIFSRPTAPWRARSGKVILSSAWIGSEMAKKSDPIRYFPKKVRYFDPIRSPTPAVDPMPVRPLVGHLLGQVRCQNAPTDELIPNTKKFSAADAACASFSWIFFQKSRIYRGNFLSRARFGAINTSFERAARGEKNELSFMADLGSLREKSWISSWNPGFWKFLSRARFGASDTSFEPAWRGKKNEPSLGPQTCSLREKSWILFQK